MKITQSNNKYVITTAEGRLHILSRKALVWNLKNVFGIKGVAGKILMKQLDNTGYAEVT